MEEAVLFSYDTGVFEDEVYRICNGYEHKYDDPVPSERVSVLWRVSKGKQIALHRISYQRKDMVVNPQHYRRLTLKQTMDGSNVLLEQDKVIDFLLKPSDLSRYDEVLYD